MKICMLTSVHSWNDIRIYGKMARSVARLGYKVSIVAPGEESAVPGCQDGVVFYRRNLPKSRWSRIFKTAAEVAHLASTIPADIYHFHDPELLPWGLKLRKKTGRPVVYDVHEDVRLQIPDKAWLPRWSRPWIARAVGWIEDCCAKRMDGIVAATPAIARRFADHPRCVVVQNFPWRDELAPWPEKNGRREHGLFVYVGGISKIRGIREMITALEIAGPEAQLALAGRWESPALRAECSRLPGWAQVEELGFLDREAVRQLLHRAQAGMVLFHPLGNHVESQPNKLFEYMSAGLPVIASDFPLWRSIVESACCGLLVHPLEPASIAAAMRWVFSHPEEARAMGHQGRRAVEEKYHWEKELPKLLDLYSVLVNQNREYVQAA